MEVYLQIEKKYSEKKQRAYLLSYFGINDTRRLINLSDEIISILLNKNLREVANIEVGYVSPKMEIKVVD